MSAVLSEFLSPSLPHLSWAALLVFVAALVRGYTGFGFTAVAIAGLNLIWPVHSSVPIILVLDFVASAALLPQGWRGADRALLRTLAIGAIAGIPVGLFLLISVADHLLKLGISIVLVLCVITLLLPRSKSVTGDAATGAGVAGFFSGVTGVAGAAGGLPVVCYLLYQQISARTQHATLLVFLTGSALLALTVVTVIQPPSTPIFAPAALLLIPTLSGLGMGFALFHLKAPRRPRLIAVPLLLALASGSLYNAGRHWMPSHYSNEYSFQQLRSTP
ncbi:sulfite exporter TauE/SafE family protein [Microbulbifer bruguierae]|uniref:Probable membrane transporter protein n=1 Tax=Microbulbifer bruguierae TaxID=3029061 RepID=A0ABY8NEB0_9GAMM|nr:sulfite exporter TauE/SafE family protein [Microbulbifer bruguierae]WGL15798.1 sulfite exporter TauE/SafE family protein [Microbulbifer bruguierae]